MTDLHTVTVLLSSFRTRQSCVKKVAQGDNSDRELRSGCRYTAHAETDAIRKLPPTYNKKRILNINLIVIRVDKTGQLKNSKPCQKCIQHLSKIKYYRVKHIYYSDDKGNIVKTTLNNLLNDNTQHVSRRFRRAFAYQK